MDFLEAEVVAIQREHRWELEVRQQLLGALRRVFLGDKHPPWDRAGRSGDDEA